MTERELFLSSFRKRQQQKRTRATRARAHFRNPQKSQQSMPIQAAEATEKARACCNNPKLLITYLWFITLIFGFMYALAAIVAAVNNNGSGEADSKSLGFV
uniref:Uncharacterized protein n=1 Tax=Globisporangium ultimum (strain ATCC 200006 / CBS 805.95 / DAOM BR144) TaxID=431595 RepID=K3WDT9_GLOUD